jgi:hypothetical protein
LAAPGRGGLTTTPATPRKAVARRALAVLLPLVLSGRLALDCETLATRR